MLTDRVVPKPQHLQVLETLQVFDVLKIFNLVFAEIKFSQFAAMLEVAQSLDFVEAEAANFDIGHVFEC